MTTTNDLNIQDELEFGQWISLQDSLVFPLEINYVWSAFDNFLELLTFFSGTTDVELETDSGKPTNTPGAIVRFDFQGSLVRNRLLYNNRQNYVWKMDMPEANKTFTLYIVTFSAHKVDEQHTEVKINVEFVLQSQNREERAETLQVIKQYLTHHIKEIMQFLEKRDGKTLLSAP